MAATAAAVEIFDGGGEFVVCARHQAATAFDRVKEYKNCYYDTDKVTNASGWMTP